jgi:hypothetical protein
MGVLRSLSQWDCKVLHASFPFCVKESTTGMAPISQSRDSYHVAGACAQLFLCLADTFGGAV